MTNTAPQGYTDPAWTMDSKRDLVEVVRCKDCKWSDPPDERSSFRYCKKHGIFPDDTDYCSYGERKE